MKALYTLLGIAFIGGLTLLIVSFSMGVRAEDYRKMLLDADNYTETTLSYEYDSRYIDLDIKLFTNDVTINYELTDEITISYFQHKRDIVKESFTNTKLSLEISRNWYFSIFPIISSDFNDMVITLPNHLIINKFSFRLGAGSLTANKLVVNETADFRLSSGEINIENLSAKDTIIKVSSGKFELSGLLTMNLVAKIASGLFTITDGKISNASVDIASGKIVFENTTVESFDKLDISSGIITLNRITTQKINSVIASGFLKVNLATKSTHSYDIEAAAGSIKINGDRKGRTYKTNGTDGNILIRLASGTIEIND